MFLQIEMNHSLNCALSNLLRPAWLVAAVAKIPKVNTGCIFLSTLSILWWQTELKIIKMSGKSLPCHLSFHELIKPHTTPVSSLNHLHVCRRIISFDVRVNGLFNQILLQLSFSQLAPHSRLIAAFCKLIRPVQVPNMLNQHLGLKK